MKTGPLGRLKTDSPLDERAATRGALRVLRAKPDYLAADTAYGTGKFLAWLRQKDIEPYITVRDQSRRSDGTFSRSDFTFDSARNVYVCPTGKILKTTGRVLSDNTLRYLASTYDCGSCPGAVAFGSCSRGPSDGRRIQCGVCHDGGCVRCVAADQQCRLGG